MPSSTSNSDIPYREIPEKPWRRIVVVAFVVVAVLVSGWEILARSMQHAPGTFQSGMMAMWADERRKLDHPDHGVRVVLLGSSRMLFNADLNILEEGLGTRPIQLALAGSSPVLPIQDVIENTDFDGLILVGFASFLFSQPFAAEGEPTDWGYFGRGAKEWYEGVSPSRRSGRFIHEQLSKQLGFLDTAFSLGELKDHYIQLPDREGADAINRNGWKLGNAYADRQVDMWAPIEEVGSFDHEQMILFWNLPRPAPEPEKIEQTAARIVEWFDPLIAKLRQRGGDIVFIRMPVSGLYLEGDENGQMMETLWTPMKEGMDALFIDAMAYPDLMDGLRTPEWSHLDRESQDLFSERIVPLVESEYQQFRGHSMQDVIDR